jgi:hypothetical protein
MKPRRITTQHRTDGASELPFRQPGAAFIDEGDPPLAFRYLRELATRPQAPAPGAPPPRLTDLNPTDRAVVVALVSLVYLPVIGGILIIVSGLLGSP